MSAFNQNVFLHLTEKDLLKIIEAHNFAVELPKYPYHDIVVKLFIDNPTCCDHRVAYLKNYDFIIRTENENDN